MTMVLLQSNLNKEWKAIDFKLNALIWQNRGGESSLDIRHENLRDVFETIKSNDVKVWLQGKTLLNAFTKNKLDETDHDEDLGVFYDLWCKKMDKIHEQLLAKGFNRIRNTRDIVSYIRNDRYIDICLFRKKRTKVGYQEKFFPCYFYDKFDSFSFLEDSFLIPSDTANLLEYMYGENASLSSSRIQRVITKLFNPAIYIRKGKIFIDKVVDHLPSGLRRTVNLFPFLGIKYQMLSKSDFLNLLVEPPDSPNWYWRKPHLDIVTNDGQNVRVKDILDFFKDEKKFAQTRSAIVETDTTRCFSVPNNLDYSFWNTGNNYFIYCLIYQFRYGVVAYNKANNYIEAGIGKPLYSKEYFEDLKPMTYVDITKFLAKHPIEITNNACTSGKHRVFAMIGRLLDGKPYIPFYSFIKH
jgi:hypothetical protein